MTSQVPDGEFHLLHPSLKPEKKGKEGRRQAFVVPDSVVDKGITATEQYLKEHNSERVAAIDREHNQGTILHQLEGELLAIQTERKQQEGEIIKDHPGVVFHENGRKIFCEDRE